MEQIIQNYFCLKILIAFTKKKFRLKISDTGLVQKYQCPKMSEHFNTVVNFINCKKLQILKILENKNSKAPKLQSCDHPNHGNQTPVWIFLKFKICI